MSLISCRCTHKCECDCHDEQYPSVHIMSCCDGECKLCNTPITTGQMEQHLIQCHGTIKEKDVGL